MILQYSFFDSEDPPSKYDSEDLGIYFNHDYIKKLSDDLNTARKNQDQAGIIELTNTLRFLKSKRIEIIKKEKETESYDFYSYSYLYYVLQLSIILVFILFILLTFCYVISSISIAYEDNLFNKCLVKSNCSVLLDISIKANPLQYNFEGVEIIVNNQETIKKCIKYNCLEDSKKYNNFKKRNYEFLVQDGKKYLKYLSYFGKNTQLILNSIIKISNNNMIQKLEDILNYYFVQLKMIYTSSINEKMIYTSSINEKMLLSDLSF